MKVRSHDPEEAIRHDVIVTIITAARRDLTLVNDQLLGFVRERTLDKRVKLRNFILLLLCFKCLLNNVIFYSAACEVFPENQPNK